MQKYTKLYIDKVTSDFDPNKDLVLGPWCLRGLFSLNKIKELSNGNSILIDIKGIFYKNEVENENILYWRL